MYVSGAGGTPPHLPSISARRAGTASITAARQRSSTPALAATAMPNLPAASPARGV